MKLVIEPMRFDDVDAVQAIERASFTTPWPPHAYRSELESNRLATYLVVRAGDRVVAGPAGLPWPEWGDCPASHLPAPPVDAGFVGDVSTVDPRGGWVEIDFPCAGRARFSVADLEPGALAYGYAVSEDDLLADLTLPRRAAAHAAEPGVARPGLGTEVALP